MTPPENTNAPSIPKSHFNSAPPKTLAFFLFFLMIRRPPSFPLFPYPTLSRSIIGLVAGFLVGITSFGSGSIVMMMLLLFFSFQPKVMVGTDMVHALILPGVTSLFLFRMHLVCRLLLEKKNIHRALVHH